MTIWLISLLVGAATFGMRLAFLVRARRAPRSFSSQRWLRFVPPAILAALVASALLPARLVMGGPLAPETLHQVLAAGLAVIVAWRFQNVLATVASGMGALWGQLWLSDTTITLSLPLGPLLLASAGLLLLCGCALVWVRPRRRIRPAGREAPSSSAAVMVTPVADPQLPAEAVSLPLRTPAGAHLHCPWCWCPLPAWALYCGQCGLPQQVPALAVTQPLAAVTVRPEGSERASIISGVRAEHTNSLLLARGGEGREMVSPPIHRQERRRSSAGQGQKGGGH